MSNKSKMPDGGYPMGPWDEAHYRGTVAEDYPHTVRGESLNERIWSDDKSTRFQAKEEQAFQLYLDGRLEEKTLSQSDDDCIRQAMIDWNENNWLKVVRVGDIEV